MKTRASHVGPICPVCRSPFSTHFVILTNRCVLFVRLAIHNGITQRTCFEVPTR